ncbi:MAG: SdpI family protein [Azospirillaceae bacterium]|nr:SdpI family protein [Azospirillaceae bacterium]
MRPYAVVMALIIAVMAGFSILTLMHVGWDARLPIHYGTAGQPDRYATAPWALAVLPLTAAVLAIGLPLLGRVLPGAKSLARSTAAWGTALVSMVALQGVAHAAMVSNAMGHPVDLGRVRALGLGVFLVVVGNVMGKVRPNRLMGIRTPWTLADDWVWDQTHRFGGWVFVAAGLVLAALALWLPPGHPRGPGLIAMVLLPTALLTVVRSYLYWRVRPGR